MGVTVRIAPLSSAEQWLWKSSLGWKLEFVLTSPKSKMKIGILFGNLWHCSFLKFIAVEEIEGNREIKMRVKSLRRGSGQQLNSDSTWIDGFYAKMVSCYLLPWRVFGLGCCWWTLQIWCNCFQVYLDHNQIGFDLNFSENWTIFPIFSFFDLDYLYVIGSQL